MRSTTPTGSASTPLRRDDPALTLLEGSDLANAMIAAGEAVRRSSSLESSASGVTPLSRNDPVLDLLSGQDLFGSLRTAANAARQPNLALDDPSLTILSGEELLSSMRAGRPVTSGSASPAPSRTNGQKIDRFEYRGTDVEIAKLGTDANGVNNYRILATGQELGVAAQANGGFVTLSDPHDAFPTIKDVAKHLVDRMLDF